MPTVTANNCEMFYETDDFTDPWRSDTETVWLQHGVGRSTKFWNTFYRASVQGPSISLLCYVVVFFDCSVSGAAILVVA